MLKNEPTYRASSRVLLTELSDGTGVLLHMDTKFYFTLNSTGVVVWKTLEHGGLCPLSEIADQIVAQFEVDRPAAEADIESIITELVDEELVTRQEPV